MNIYTKNLDLLKILLAISEEENLSKAALRLHLSQPALSHSLQRLREEFDDKLFVRAARGLVPTPKARELFPKVRAVLIAAEKLYASESVDFRTVERSFVLAATTYFELRVAGPLMQTILREAPGVTLETVSLQGDFPKLSLERGETDIAIAAYFDSLPESFRMRSLGRDPHVCVLRRDHPVLKKGLSISEYLDAEHIRIAVPPGRPSSIDTELKRTGKQRRIVAHFGNFLSPPAVVAETDLLLTCPESLAKRYVELFPVVIAKVPTRVPPIEIKMVWHERNHEDPFHRWMRENIAAALKPK